MVEFYFETIDARVVLDFFIKVYGISINFCLVR